MQEALKPEIRPTVIVSSRVFEGLVVYLRADDPCVFAPRGWGNPDAQEVLDGLVTVVTISGFPSR